MMQSLALLTKESIDNDADKPQEIGLTSREALVHIHGEAGLYSRLDMVGCLFHQKDMASLIAVPNEKIKERGCKDMTINMN